MKKFIGILAAALLAMLPLAAQTPSVSYNAQAGVSFFTAAPATATAVSGPQRLPNFSGLGTLTITGVGITGSPSGCTVALAYQGNNAASAGSATATVAFTPAVSVQQFTVSPGVTTGDQLVATFACSSTYPTAGTITASFSPYVPISADPCLTAPKSSAVVAQASAGTTQLVTLSATKAIYVCGFTASMIGTTPTLTLEYGGSTTCTSPTALTGTISVTTGTNFNLGWGGELVSVPAGSGLCVVGTGNSGSGIQGVLTYVQQ